MAEWQVTSAVELLEAVGVVALAILGKGAGLPMGEVPSL